MLIFVLPRPLPHEGAENPKLFAVLEELQDVYEMPSISTSRCTMSTMANAFGVSVAFIDKELSRFISAGRINAKIDKV